MSESRQRFTGRWRWISALVIAALVWVILFTLSLFTNTWLTESVDPRFLTVGDMTWKRLLVNMVSKPGLRALAVAAISSLGLFIGQTPRKKLVKQRSSFSLEWAMEGRRDGSLLEYGSFVGVV